MLDPPVWLDSPPWLDSLELSDFLELLDSLRSFGSAGLIDAPDPVPAMAGASPLGEDQPSGEQTGTPMTRSPAATHDCALTRDRHGEPHMTIALLGTAPAWRSCGLGSTCVPPVLC